MALIEYDVYKQKLRDLEPELKKLGDALDIDAGTIWSALRRCRPA